MRTLARRGGLVGTGVAVAIVVGLLAFPAVRSASSTSEPVAFSVRARTHVSEGDPTLITYQKIVSNVGAGWFAPSTFRAPISGRYYLSVEFVKDAFAHGGTKDDVYVYIEVHTPPAAPVTPAIPFSGQDSGMRELGAAATIVYLPAGSQVRTLAFSDGYGLRRHIKEVYFSGFLID